MQKPKTWREIVAFLLGFALVFLAAWAFGWIPTYAEYSRALLHVGHFLNAIAPALTAIATAFIGWFTFTLYKATTGLVEAAKIQSRDTQAAIIAAETTAEASKQTAEGAARQAKIAERAFIEVERPYIFVSGVTTFATRQTGEPVISYNVANYGKTPAIIKHVGVAISTGDEPGDPLRVTDTHPLFQTRIISPNTSIPVLEEVPEDKICFTITTGGSVVPQFTGTETLFFRVIVWYRGPFTDHHETSACWRYDDLTNLLVQWGAGDYNYEK